MVIILLKICLYSSILFPRIDDRNLIKDNGCFTLGLNGPGTMEIIGKSIDGRMDYNQDRIYQSTRGEAFILAVADGMGGSGGGEVASQIVIDTCREKFEQFAAAPDPGSLERLITDIVSASQQRIRDRFTVEPELKGMGTTLTIALGAGEEYVVGNIGDSRTYLLSGGVLAQITKDNSFIQEYRDNHPAGDSDAPMLDRMSHVLTHSLSGGDDTADLYPGGGSRFRKKEGEMLLLCSDGLIVDKIGNISDHLLEMMTGASSVAEAANRLVDWAYTNGSIDNISLLLCSFSDWEKTVEMNVPVVAARGKRRLVIFIPVIIVCAAAATVFFFSGIRNKASIFKQGDDESVERPAILYREWSVEHDETTQPPGDRIRWNVSADKDTIDCYIISYHDVALNETYHDTLGADSGEGLIWAGDLREYEYGSSYRVWLTTVTRDGDTASSEKLLIKGRD